jgi:hypothetical protein
MEITNRIEVVMATLQQNVAEKFLAKLMHGKSLDAEKIKQLRKLLADSKKPKAEDFIKIFTAPAGGGREVIKIETAHIEEVRGIRKLDIDFRKETFAISGPNGSGKSGVIDAIEFGLTGQIGRLTGRGTKGLSVAEHGPHVDKTKFPDAAFVELKVFFPALGKSATITRKVSAPKKPKIVPADPDVKAALDEIADQPEITLSRREILRFILVEPAKRSEEIPPVQSPSAARSGACSELYSIRPACRRSPPP